MLCVISNYAMLRLSQFLLLPFCCWWNCCAHCTFFSSCWFSMSVIFVLWVTFIWFFILNSNVHSVRLNWMGCRSFGCVMCVHIFYDFIWSQRYVDGVPIDNLRIATSQNGATSKNNFFSLHIDMAWHGMTCHGTHIYLCQLPAVLTRLNNDIFHWWLK